MFRQILWSLRKSSKLRRISEALAGKPDFGASVLQTFAQRGLDGMKDLLEKEDIQRKKLFVLVHKDPGTSYILTKYGINDEELGELYSSFIRHGAGVYRNGHWVAASTLAFQYTLEYAVTQKRNGDEQFQHACRRLVQYFDGNETGPILD